MLPSRSFFGRRSRSRRVQRPVPEAHLVLAALGQLGLGGVPGEVPATGDLPCAAVLSGRRVAMSTCAEPGPDTH